MQTSEDRSSRGLAQILCSQHSKIMRRDPLEIQCQKFGLTESVRER